MPGLALPGLAPDADLYARITRVVEDPERADLATAQWLERCLDEHRRIEDTIGGRPLLAVVREQLRVVADLARCADGPLAVRLVSLAAQYAQFMAWLCIDN
ncbi:MAG TPA: XRE family transcriptional regulator, partial [Streptosporangiaceae bacterium]